MPRHEKPPLGREPSREPIWTIKALHHMGREVPVHIIEARFISEGRFGVVYEVIARTVGIQPIPGAKPPFNERRRGHDFPAIIKVFKHKSSAAYALSIYDLFREAGLKTLPTYRVDLNESVAIMTELNTEKRVTLSSNNWNVRSNEVHIERISNWQEILPIYFSEAKKATEHKIMLKRDVYFYQVPTDTTTPVIDFFAADFDTVEHPSDLRPEELLRYNLHILADSAGVFLTRYVEPKQCGIHMKELRVVLKEFLPEKKSSKKRP